MKILVLFTCLIYSSFIFVSCSSSASGEGRNSETVEEAAGTEVDAVEEKEAASANNPENKVAEAPTLKNSDDKEPFDYLEKLTVFEADYMTTEVKYNTSISQVFNQTLSELPENDPFHYSEEGPSMMDIKVLKTKISPSGPYYYVIFSQGPSADPAFIFYKEGSYDQSAFYVMAIKLYIPGNGNVYAEGHTNNTFNKRRKFTLSNGKFVEADQPFYYVGLKTHTLKPVKLYKSENLSQVIASLPANYAVEVLINNPEKSTMFLVRTDFGLTGWVDIPMENMFGGEELIKGIYMAGD